MKQLITALCTILVIVNEPKIRGMLQINCT